MSVGASLDVRLQRRVPFDVLWSALTKEGWHPGEKFGFYPPGVDVGDWQYVERSQLEAALQQVREREARGDVVGFDAVFDADICGMFLLYPDSISFLPGARVRLGDDRTTDVTAYLRAVLLPIRSAVPIEGWCWSEDA